MSSADLSRTCSGCKAEHSTKQGDTTKIQQHNWQTEVKWECRVGPAWS